MSGVTFNARRSARISTAKLGQRSKPDSAFPIEEASAQELVSEVKFIAESETATPAPVYSGPESLSFLKLASKNPALLDLVNALDLVEVASTTIKPEALPPLVERIPEQPVNPKLQMIAQRTFNRGRTCSETEAIDLIATTYHQCHTRPRPQWTCLNVRSVYNKGFLFQRGDFTR